MATSTYVPTNMQKATNMQKMIYGHFTHVDISGNSIVCPCWNKKKNERCEVFINYLSRCKDFQRSSQYNQDISIPWLAGNTVTKI